MDNSYVVVIGGTNIDIQGFPYGKIIFNDSNPGKIKISLGGVGRNISENLARLGINTKLISVIGKDAYGSKIIEQANLIGLDVNDSLFVDGQHTSTYLSILDEWGDMVAAISHMDIYDKMTVEFIKKKKHVIKNSSFCIIDANIHKEVIEYVLLNHKDIDFFLDTVSTKKAEKIKEYIGYFHTIKPNKIEAELLSGIEINNYDDLKRTSDYFLNKGVKNIYISLGKEGVFYSDGNNMEQIKIPDIKVVNTTGAGDAFTAAIAYGHYYNIDIEKTAKMAIAASIIAISHEDTINPCMTVNNIIEKMKEIGLC